MAQGCSRRSSGHPILQAPWPWMHDVENKYQYQQSSVYLYQSPREHIRPSPVALFEESVHPDHISIYYLSSLMEVMQSIHTIFYAWESEQTSYNFLFIKAEQEPNPKEGSVLPLSPHASILGWMHSGCTDSSVGHVRGRTGQWRVIPIGTVDFVFILENKYQYQQPFVYLYQSPREHKLVIPIGTVDFVFIAKSNPISASAREGKERDKLFG